VASSFVPGPPKAVAVTPAPGSLAAPGTVTRVDVTFHDDVVAPASAFSLVGARHGAVSAAPTYDGATRTVSLAIAPLPADEYTLTVAEAVTSAAGVALDGEIAGNALPSGDGLPGGAAVVTFTVGRPPRSRLASQGAAP